MINSTRYAAAAKKNLGYSLKLARAGSSLLQKDAAELSGVARCRISNYERGAQIPSWGNLNRLISVYNLSAAEVSVIKSKWSEAYNNLQYCRQK